MLGADRADVCPSFLEVFAGAVASVSFPSSMLHVSVEMFQFIFIFISSGPLRVVCGRVDLLGLFLLVFFLCFL